MKQFPALDGIRGLAALMVLVSHISNTTGILGSSLGKGGGQLGVILFFCLSGFLMAHISRDQPFNPSSITSFFIRRFSRVYPLFAAVVLGSLALSLLGQSIGVDLTLLRNDTVRSAVAHFFLLRGEQVLWTIPVEMAFYVLFPLFWWARARSFESFVISIALTFALSALVFNFQRIDSLPLFLNMFSHLTGFLVGIITYEIHKKTTHLPAATALAGIGFALILLSYPSVQSLLWDETGVDPHQNFALFTGCGLFILGALHSSAAEKVLGTHMMAHLGATSYSLYLLHFPILLFWARVADNLGLGPWMVAGIVTVCSLIAAELSFRFFESPSRRFLNRHLVHAVAKGPFSFSRA